MISRRYLKEGEQRVTGAVILYAFRCCRECRIWHKTVGFYPGEFAVKIFLIPNNSL